MAKIKLSETIHFLPTTAHNFDNPGESQSNLKISVEPSSLVPGGTVYITLCCTFSDDATEQSTILDYVAVSLEGQINVNGASTTFVHAAEIEHGHEIRPATSFIQPVSIRIPSNAITTQADVIWKISARAVWERSRVIQDQTELTIFLEPQA